MSTPRPVSVRPPRWQLGVALVSFLGASFFGSRAGVDFERWVVTGLWVVVGLIWLVLWRMDVNKHARALARAAQPADSAPASTPDHEDPSEPTSVPTSVPTSEPTSTPTETPTAEPTPTRSSSPPSGPTS